MMTCTWLYIAFFFTILSIYWQTKHPTLSFCTDAYWCWWQDCPQWLPLQGRLLLQQVDHRTMLQNHKKVHVQERSFVTVGTWWHGIPGKRSDVRPPSFEHWLAAAYVGMAIMLTWSLLLSLQLGLEELLHLRLSRLPESSMCTCQQLHGKPHMLNDLIIREILISMIWAGGLCKCLNPWEQGLRPGFYTDRECT